jgi:hypothetical protein
MKDAIELFWLAVYGMAILIACVCGAVLALPALGLFRLYQIAKARVSLEWKRPDEQPVLTPKPQ